MKLLRRYDDETRMNHWFIALTFILAGLSGLAFFHPSFFFLTNLFGGGSWARILHPFIGMAMALAFFVMAMKVWHENVMNDADREWRKHMGDLMKGDKSKMPPVGKYNAGQKMVFWAMVISMLILVVTGILFWQPYFANSFSIPARRIAVLLHSVSAVVLILSVIVHVYASIWVKGTIRAMTRGTVTESWAKANHPLWHEEVTRKGNGD
jgi:formate dehydrogenase subunit gamma